MSASDFKALGLKKLEHILKTIDNIEPITSVIVIPEPEITENIIVHKLIGQRQGIGGGVPDERSE